MGLLFYENIVGTKSLGVKTCIIWHSEIVQEKFKKPRNKSVFALLNLQKYVYHTPGIWGICKDFVVEGILNFMILT